MAHFVNEMKRISKDVADVAEKTLALVESVQTEGTEGGNPAQREEFLALISGSGQRWSELSKFVNQFSESELLSKESANQTFKVLRDCVVGLRGLILQVVQCGKALILCMPQKDIPDPFNNLKRAVFGIKSMIRGAIDCFEALTSQINLSTLPKPLVPVTVLTGFLGSGKTTLLNHILTESHGLRIAVIENEFGEIGIDDALVKEKINENEEIFEMNNGCICCTVRGDLIRILATLIERRQTKWFDYILIETTGLADPAPIAQTFFTVPELSSKLRLDGIVTLVDALHIEQHLDEVKSDPGIENESVEQIAFADKVILNKIDLVTPGDVERIKARISAINKCEVIAAQGARVDLRRILNIQAFDIDKVLEIEPQFLDDQEHMHDASVSSVGISLEGQLELSALNQWFGKLLREKGVDIFRMKGVLSIKGMSTPFVFQGVHMLFKGEPLEGAVAAVQNQNKLVFIGRNLDRSELTNGFKACFV